MPQTRFGVCLIVAGLVVASCDDPAEPEERATLEILSDSVQLLVGDTVQLTARFLDAAGEVVPADISWSSSDSTVAAILADGRVVGRQPGTVLIRATSAAASDSISIAVAQVQGCDATGASHSGVITSATTWAAIQSPHFVQDSIFLRAPLTIEAGAIVCAGPGAHFVVSGGSLTANGRADRRVQFVALDTVAGWNGFVASATETRPGGQIALHYADVYYASGVDVGFESTGGASHSYFRRTAVNAAANLSFFSIRHSVVEDADVALANGTFEETVVRRGNVRFLPAQPGAGAVTLNGGRIEGSPGTALTIGSTFSYRTPAMNIVKAPVIVGSRGGIAHMPAEDFFAMWPSAVEQVVLWDNPNRTIRLWHRGSSYGNVQLGGRFEWHLSSPLSQANITELSVGADATVIIDAFFTVRGRLGAVGKPHTPIRLQSIRNCRGAANGCALAIVDTASAVLSYVSIENMPLIAGGRSAHLDHVNSNSTIALAATAALISDSEIRDVPVPTSPVAASLTVTADSARVDRVAVRGTTSPAMAAMALSGSNIVVYRCDVMSNAGDAVRVTAGANILIRECNLESNGGLGVNNQTTTRVDARQNWWGDPAGPLDAGGDGVSGLVDFSSPLPARRQ